MGLRPGMTNNPNGRRPGSKNKTTEQIRGMLKTFIENNIEDLQDQYNLLRPIDKLMFFDKILNKVLPNPTDNILQKLTDDQLDEVIKRLKENQLTPN
jgi:hypothetical protein